MTVSSEWVPILANRLVKDRGFFIEGLTPDGAKLTKGNYIIEYIKKDYHISVRRYIKVNPFEISTFIKVNNNKSHSDWTADPDKIFDSVDLALQILADLKP